MNAANADPFPDLHSVSRIHEINLYIRKSKYLLTVSPSLKFEKQYHKGWHTIAKQGT